MASPTRSHHTGQRTEGETRSSPGPRTKRVVLGSVGAVSATLGPKCFIFGTELLQSFVHLEPVLDGFFYFSCSRLSVPLLYLFNKVAAELNISGHFVRNRHGDDVAHPLDLMDDSVNKGEILPVFYPDSPVSNHLAELLLDLV